MKEISSMSEFKEMVQDWNSKVQSIPAMPMEKEYKIMAELNGEIAVIDEAINDYMQILERKINRQENLDRE